MNKLEKNLLERHGTVVATNPKSMTVRIQPEAACGACSQRSHCHAERLIEIERPADARPGDEVTVGLPSTDLTLAALCAYLLPAAALIVGAVLGEMLAGTPGSMAGAVIGLLLALALSRWISLRHLHPEPVLTACTHPDSTANSGEPRNECPRPPL